MYRYLAPMRQITTLGEIGTLTSPKGGPNVLEIRL